MPKPQALREGIDYYTENGLFVFTEHFLLKRGYCCQSGCRHCPYGYRKEEPVPDKQRQESEGNA
ncbi:MAG: hypothetical protein H6557_29580 [Lewinellaceae bacterium]|nr:hypothetical protein [Phaeodactylibacter sp.]MCB9040800.1 hypothetical protein [Lewinellaceae bacterium]